MFTLVKNVLALSCILLGLTSVIAMEQQPNQQQRSPFALRKAQGTAPKLDRDSSRYSGIDSDSDDEVTEQEVNKYLDSLEKPNVYPVSTEDAQALSPRPARQAPANGSWVSYRPQRPARADQLSIGTQKLESFSASPEASPEEVSSESPVASPTVSPKQPSSWVSPRLQRNQVPALSKFATLKKGRFADKQVDTIRAKPTDALEFSRGKILNIDSEFHSLLDDYTTKFHDAIRQGNFTKVYALYRDGADINSMGSDGLTALQYAINTKNLELINFLKDHGAQLPERELPTRLSISGPLNQLVMQPVAPTTSGLEEESPVISPLHSPIPSPRGVPKLVFRPVGHGATSPEEKSPVSSERSLVCKPSRLEASDSEDEAEGAPTAHSPELVVKLAGNNNNTPKLSLDRKVKDLRIAKKSNGDGPVRDTRAQTLLKAAKYPQDFKQLESLIEQGTDINALNAQGVTLLTQAVRAKNWDAVKLLVLKGADVNKQGKKFDPTLKRDIAEPTALQEAARLGLVKYVQFLLLHKANPNIADGRGTTPLMVAVFGVGDAAVTIARLLINAKANVLAKNDKGETALEFAGIFRDKIAYLDYVDRKQQDVLKSRVSQQSYVDSYVESGMEGDGGSN